MITSKTDVASTSFEARQVYVAPDGTMSIEEFLSFKMMRCLQATADDIEEIVAESEGGKIRFKVVREGGRIRRIGSAQGQSERIARMMDFDEALTLDDIDALRAELLRQSQEKGGET